MTTMKIIIKIQYNNTKDITVQKTYLFFPYFPKKNFVVFGRVFFCQRRECPLLMVPVSTNPPDFSSILLKLTIRHVTLVASFDVLVNYKY